MSAHENLQPKQLAMFMHPDDFHAQVEPNDFHHEPNNAAGWASKLNAANQTGWNEDVPEGTTLKKEIAANGIERPVSVWHPTETELKSGWKSGPYLRNGHHRVSVATNLTAKGQTTYIPVEHTDAQTFYDRNKT